MPNTDTNTTHPPTPPADQMAFAVEPAFTLEITEVRGKDSPARITVNAQQESVQRELARLLLGRRNPLVGAGPWSQAVPGGRMEVALVRVG